MLKDQDTPSVNHFEFSIQNLVLPILNNMFIDI